MNRSKLKIAVDIIMIVLIASLYCKNVISLMYHEAAGLALLLVFAVHITLNFGFMRAMSARFFSADTSARARLNFVMAVLLIVSWAASGITGVMVSKKIFAFNIASMNPIHFFTSAIALLITGVHVGLHWNYLRAKIYAAVPALSGISRGIVIIIMAMFIGLGVYGFASSGMLRWLSAPFRAEQRHHAPRNSAGIEQRGRSEPNMGNVPPGESAAEQRVGRTDEQRRQPPFSFMRLLDITASFLGIIYLTAAVTRLAELLAVGRHHNRLN